MRVSEMTLAEMHDYVCHFDGSECLDGCDVPGDAHRSAMLDLLWTEERKEKQALRLKAAQDALVALWDARDRGEFVSGEMIEAARVEVAWQQENADEIEEDWRFHWTRAGKPIGKPSL